MKTALVILAPGFEETEAVTIIDLLRRAEIDTRVASIVDLFVTGSHNIGIKADVKLTDVMDDIFDIMILPGGQPGTNNLKNSNDVIGLINKQYNAGKYVAAICAAPAVLDHAGLTKGKKITSYPADRNEFKASTYLEKNVVHDGQIITSRGVGTAIDFSLAIIRILKGENLAIQLAQRIVYQQK